jgi:hypothetical protein
MSAGTITLTNGSAIVGGAGTSFSTELAAGDFIVVTVGGVPYTLPVKTVDGNAQLTLVSNFTGPTQSGSAWSAVPRVALNMVTAALVAQSAEALRGLNYDKQNWQSIFTGTGNVTVKLPDGSYWTGPAWNSFGSAATKNTGTSKGEVPLLGTLGFGFAQQINNYNQYYDRAIFLATDAPYSWFPGSQQGTIINVPYPSNTQFVSRWMGDTSGRAFFQSVVNGAYSNAAEICLIGKSVTVDGNGFIKKASPIVNIFGDGSAETNEESEGVTVQRVDKGVYLIEGCMGLNSDAAWGGIDGGFEIPTDRNKQPLIWLDFEVNADGSVFVKTYHRTHPEAPAFARNELQGVSDGDPVDIAADQFVSVRVEMPADSIWNKKQLAANKALEDVRELEAIEEKGS